MSDDLRDLTAELAGAAVRVGARAAAVVRRTAIDVESLAKRKAPVDTGTLRRSIHHEFEGDGRSAAMAAEIGTDVEYGPYVEFGTSRTPPQPYLGPALDEMAPTFEERLADIADPLDPL